jgi:hypothetical protein
MRSFSRLATVGAVALIIFAPSGRAFADPDLVTVSRGDPFVGCTAGGTPTSTLYPGAEVEPSASTDQRHTNRVTAVWQQGRWSDGGSQGLVSAFSDDAGRSFHRVVWPLTQCSGGLDYQRASDPFVSTGPDGTVYGSALAFDADTPRNGVVALTSRDGGRSYRNVTKVIEDTSIQFFNDKNSVTADPHRPGWAYQVWDRLDGGPTGLQLVTGPTLLSITRDHGRTWSRPKVIVDTAPFQQTIGNVIVGDPRTGNLYNFYDSIQFTDINATDVVFIRYEMVRSTDGGRTWSRPVVVAPDTSVLDVNPNNPDQVLRTGTGLPSPAIDPRTGELYMAYEGTDFTGGQFNQIQLVHSADGGRTWDAPVRVNKPQGVPAFTASIAVTRDGDVGVTYYDVRTLRPGNMTTLPTAAFLTISPRGGKRFGHERQISPIFDHLQAPNARGFFLGDYQALATFDDRFRAVFVTTNRNQPNNRTDVRYGQFRSFEFDADRTAAAPSDQAAGFAAAGAPHQRRPLRSRT